MLDHIISLPVSMPLGITREIRKKVALSLKFEEQIVALNGHLVPTDEEFSPAELAAKILELGEEIDQVKIQTASQALFMQNWFTPIKQWLRISRKLVLDYYRSIGLKQNQLKVVDYKFDPPLTDAHDDFTYLNQCFAYYTALPEATTLLVDKLQECRCVQVLKDEVATWVKTFEEEGPSFIELVEMTDKIIEFDMTKDEAMFVELKQTLQTKIQYYEQLAQQNLPTPSSSSHIVQLKLKVSRWQKRYTQLRHADSVALSRVETLIKDSTFTK